MTASLLEIHAREKFGLPEAWRAYRFECLPHSPAPTTFYNLEGGVAPLVKAGTRKGRPNWKALAPETKANVSITVKEHEAWELEWEIRTGKCRECEGSGQTLASMSVTEGVKYRTCSACGGSGTPKTKETA